MQANNVSRNLPTVSTALTWVCEFREEFRTDGSEFGLLLACSIVRTSIKTSPALNIGDHRFCDFLDRFADLFEEAFSTPGYLAGFKLRGRGCYMSRNL